MAFFDPEKSNDVIKGRAVSIPAQLNEMRIAVLRSPSDEFGERTANNTLSVLEQARLTATDFDIAQPISTSGFSVFALCTERLSTVHPELLCRLTRFVEDGGGLVVLHRGLHDAFSRLFGLRIYDHRRAVTPVTESGGLVFPSRVLPSFAGLRLEENDIEGHAAFDLVPADDANVVATTWTGKPLAWRVQRGLGQVLYWNSTIFSEKRTHGLIVESIEAVAPVTVRRIANVGVVQVDDFPAPLAVPEPDLAGIADTSDFYAQHWWPDVHNLAARHDIPLTCFVTFDYTVSTPDGPAKALPTGEALVASGNLDAIRRYPPAEIGLHGYSHVSLVAENWVDRDAMEASVTQARDAWNDAGLGAPARCYAPPMNSYDADGIGVLSRNWPEIETVCSIQIGAYGTLRNFEPEPWDESLFCLPRATSGHEINPTIMFDCASQVALLGAWTHFIHPDDLLDVPRPGVPRAEARNPASRPWRGINGVPGLHDELADLLTTVKTRFPWLRFYSTSTAAEVIKDCLAAPARVTIAAEKITLMGPPGSHFRIRLNGVPQRRILSCAGALIVTLEETDDYVLAIVALEKEQAELCYSRVAPESGGSALPALLRRLVSALS